MSSKDKKSIIFINTFEKFLNECGSKPKKIWIDKVSKLYNRSMKSWLEDNGLEMYLASNEGKSIVSEKFIRNLNIKICKYMTWLWKNVYTV